MEIFASAFEESICQFRKYHLSSFDWEMSRLFASHLIGTTYVAKKFHERFIWCLVVPKKKFFFEMFLLKDDML